MADKKNNAQVLSDYVPPKVWTWDKGDDGNRFANINRPISGATHEKELPVGKHDLQLYSLGTPNGGENPNVFLKVDQSCFTWLKSSVCFYQQIRNAALRLCHG